MRGRKMNRKSSKRSFSRGATRVHKKNLQNSPCVVVIVFDGGI